MIGAAAIAAGLWVNAPARASTPPPRTVLLFVASWCAPCRAEIVRLPEITAAAAPFRVMVVPIDARPATVRMMKAVPSPQRLLLSSEASDALMRRLAGTVPGLPLSIATRADGTPCAIVRRPLYPEDAAAMRVSCTTRLPEPRG